MSEALIMTEEYWASSHYSIARYCGSISVNGEIYTIVNKDGKDIFQCSQEAIIAGRDKAIEPGEPCDLCRNDLIPAYRKLGRDKIFALIKEGKDAKTIINIANKTKL